MNIENVLFLCHAVVGLNMCNIHHRTAKNKMRVCLVCVVCSCFGALFLLWCMLR